LMPSCSVVTIVTEKLGATDHIGAVKN